MQEEIIEGVRLSPQQKHLWSLQQTDHNESYRACCAILLEGHLRREVLNSALQNVVARFEVLRTVFQRLPGMRMPIQVVTQSDVSPPDEYDLRDLEAAEQETVIEKLFNEARHIPIDFEQGPLVYFSLILIAADRHLLVVSLPSLCADAAALRILLQEISSAYNANLRGEQLPDVLVQYADLSEWQNELFEGDDTRAGREYWLKQDTSAWSTLSLPSKRQIQQQTDFEPGTHVLKIDVPLYLQLKALAVRKETSLQTLLTTCWQILLWRLTLQPEMIIGVYCDGRNYEELQDTLGLFAKFLPLPGCLDERHTFAGLLRQFDETRLELYKWQDCFAWEYLAAGAESDLAACFIPACFEWTEQIENCHAEGLSFSIYKQYVCHDRFELKLSCFEREAELVAELHYDAGLFDTEEVERLGQQFLTILADAVSRPDVAVGNLKILSDRERHRLLEEFNQTATLYSADTCIHHIFEAHVEKDAEAVALICEDQELTYGELNRRANQLANHLRRLGVGPEVLVGLCVERSLEMIVGLLGILKAGGAYVPLDPAYPSARLKLILNDAQPPVLLTQERLAAGLPAYEGRCLRLDADWDAIAVESDENPSAITTTKNLAYVIYTSGSTGSPKGVAVEHGQLLNYVHGILDKLALPFPATFATASTFAADLGNTAIFPALCSGGCLNVILPERFSDPEALADYVTRYPVDCLKIVPSHLAALLTGSELGNILPRQRLILGGEASGWGLIEKLRTLAPDCRILNHYGPTETTVGVLTYQVEEIVADQCSATVPIGYPIANTQIYLLDSNLQPVSIWATGEVYIGGHNVTRGYHNSPELTAEKFIANPFAAEPGARLYRTGDLARYLPNGSIEFLGRRDHQVKIRGFRIELGEIVAALSDHPFVQQSIALVQGPEGGEGRLVAYFVPAQTPPPAVDELRRWLEQRLPHYMVPAAFVMLDCVPLTPNGKVDRRALPAFETGPGPSFVTPRTITEEVIAGIWMEILHVGQVSIHDSFFEIGGHSLLATQMISRLRSIFQIEFPVRRLFEHPTLAQLAASVETTLRVAEGTAAPAIVPVARDVALPLSFAQQRLWFLDQLEPGSSFYNIPAAVRLQGTLDLTALEQSFNEVIRRHESLRTRFGVVNGVPVQVIDEAPEFSLPVLDLSTIDEAEARRVATEESQRPFDLAAGPLLRATVLRLGEQEHVLLCTMHHIISDGWSMGVLIRELTTLYEGYLQGESSPLQELPIQYADYAHWQRGWLQGEVLEKQLSYWKEHLAGAPAVLELPTDYPRPAVQSFHGANQSLTLPAELSQGLKALSQREGVTLFMTLLAAFQTLLSRYSGQDDIVVSTGIANRNRAETEPLIGFFVNTLVLRTDLSGEPSFAELLGRVREVTLGAYAHQDVPFELLVEALAPERDARYTPLFQVMLVLQNARVGEEVELEGLHVSRVGGESGTAKFDLTLFVAEHGEELALVLEYNTDLFAGATIEQMLESFRRLVEGIVAAPERSIGSFEMIDAAERGRLTGGGRELSGEGAELVSVAAMFDAAAARNTSAVAIECGERQLSYGELQERANTLANYLLTHGAGPGTVVALLTGDMSETVVGILGSLKAGAAFMPLDVRQPALRLRKLLELAPPQFLLTETKVLAGLAQLISAENEPLKVMFVDGPVSVQSLCALCLCGERVEEHSHHRDTEDTEVAQRKPVEVLEDFLEYHNPAAPDVSSDPDQLSYIYFTSGSSGTPKAIAGRLKGIAHFINWEIAELGVGAGVRVSQLLSPSFDGSLRDVFLPLCVGGVVCVPEQREQVLAGRGLVQWLEQARIEVMHCVPSVFRALVNEELRADELSALRYVVMAGEALVGRDVGKWKAVYGERVTLLNLYGTSETTMAKFSYRVAVGDEEREVMPIGKPMTGAEAYLLDERGEPCGRGMVGEIYIRTPYRSLGYYAQPELTAAVFVPNPFSTDASDLVHKTGDMGRVLEDGNFEYLGRRDEQVKVRGARVELKEVENAVRGQAGVLDVAVIEREDGSGYTYLCAYLVLAEGVQAVAVAEGLEQELPDYMVPSAYVEMAELPRTISGKVDRRALPEVGGAGGAAEYVSARTPVEELLVESWEQLLGRERVGIEDNFFRLGGHSLLATQVMSRVRESFGVEVGLRVLFERPTVRGLAEVIEEQLRGAEGLAAPAIGRVSRDGELMLSFAQQRLWFLDQLEPGSNAYNIPAAVRLQGELNANALEQSLGEVIRRHEALRTTFATVAGEPVQVISEAGPYSLAIEDFTQLPEAERESKWRALAGEEARQAFDLQSGPLLRVRLLRLGESDHVLLYTMHHIISDGWSMGVLIRELTTLYEAYARGEESSLAELSIQYADYAQWQRQWLQGEVLESQLEYWKQQLAGAPPLLELPTDFARPAVQTFRGAHLSRSISPELTANLTGLSRQHGVTLFMTLLAAFQTLLYRYSAQQDILVSTGIANRTRAETEPLIGFFVNTVVLRTDFSDNPSFSELLERVREITLGAYAHQDVPFELVVEALEPERDARYTPLFQVMFVLQNAPRSAAMSGSLKVDVVGAESGTAKFDLTMFVQERAEQLEVVLEYNTDLFKSESVRQMLESWEVLLEAMVREPGEAVGSIALVSADEHRRLITAAGARAVTAGAEQSIEQPGVIELFDENVLQFPTKTAITCGEQQLTYAELGQRANTLANFLTLHGATAGTLVAIYSDDSIHLITAILATLKAGAAFVPLDTRLPEQRLKLLLTLAPPQFLLTESHLAEPLTALTQTAEAALKVICLDAANAWTSVADASVPALTSDPDQLSYIYFTSGSTGLPKPIAGRLSAIAHFIDWEIHELGLASSVRVSHLLSASFDGSLRDIFVPLCAGGTLCVPAQREIVLDGRALLQWLDHEQITLVHCVPSMLRAMVNEEMVIEALQELKYVVLAGEPLMGRDVRSWKQVYGERVELVNLYGTSETTMAKFSYRVQAGDEQREVLPIGQPITGAAALIVDEKGRPCSPGMVGEIYIQTPYRSLGYYGQPELTSELFISNPFSADPSDIVYRTGDLARVLPDGNFEFLGRRDHQVKIRGVRVELAEVERVLGGHEGVSEVVVIAHEDGHGYQYLCAYLVLAAERKTVEVAEHAEAQLPDYMVPSAYLVLDQLPQTLSGKVDRRALAALERSSASQREADRGSYERAQTPLEEIVASIWGQVLGLEEVGREENFFRLGGHSLLATQVLSRVREVCGVEVSLRHLFEESTVRGVVAAIEQELKGDKKGQRRLEPVTKDGELRLSFAQQRLWFLDQLQPGSNAYNIPAAMRLQGELNANALEQSLGEVIRRHEALRTTFAVVAGEPVQVISEAGPYGLPIEDLRHLPEAERESKWRVLAGEEARQAFDLQSGPLLRARLLRLGESDHVLLYTMHHIISDGWSMGVLIRELTTLYEAYARGEESPLTELSIQYADYAQWQREWLQGEVLASQLEYWKQQLAGAPPQLELPTDFARPAVQTFRGAVHRVSLSSTLTAALKQLSKREDVTLFMTLLAAFQTLLHRYTAQTDIVLGTPIANRTRGETEPLIGCFVNTLVLRTDLSADPTFVELLKRVRDVALGGYAHQHVPFEMLVEALQPERDVSRSPLFQVMLVLQNAPKQPLEPNAELRLSGVEVDHRTAKFDLTLSLAEGTEGLEGVWEYNTDLFEAATIERMKGHFEVLLEGIITAPERRLSELPLLTDAEQQQLLMQGKLTESGYSENGEACLHQLFEAQVERTPEAIALVYEEQRLSYTQLNQRANQLAHYLQSLDVAPGSFVAVCMRPSVELIIALLGILKAGAAYLPLDPAYPQERLSLMLSVSRASALLTEEVVLSGRSVSVAAVLCLDSQWSMIDSHSRENPRSQVVADNAAYLIFTSGSTGTPKAAATCHRTYTNLLYWYIEEFSITAADRVLLLSSISFDLTQKNIFAALMVGARLSLSCAVYDARQRALQIQEQQITFVNCTPSAFYPLVEACEDMTEHPLGSLRKVILGGERITLGRLQRWLSDEGTSTELVNSYGPTECTDVVSYHRVTKEEVEAAGEVPLGWAIPNTHLWVADKSQRLVPVGVVGELWIGGAAVGMGYVTDAALTSDKYRPDPWSAQAGARVYRTGDKVRYLNNGELLYLGRVDEQVKVRGYRIELGEVETALMAHAGVRDAVVLAISTGAAGATEGRLVAYVVAQEQTEINVGELRRHLEQRLPMYMIPSSFIMLPRIPLTTSGKVDRRALPVPDQQRPELGQLYVAPRSDLEGAIVKVWREVLGVEKVGVYDNFFDLGGHSLLMVQVQLKLREVGERAVTMIELFQYPTVDSLAKYMSQSQSDPASLQKVHERAAKQKEAIKRQRQIGKPQRSI
jgi:amino acid adenylation domain-containing protein